MQSNSISYNTAILPLQLSQAQKNSAVGNHKAAARGGQIRSLPELNGFSMIRLDLKTRRESKLDLSCSLTPMNEKDIL